MDMNGKAGIHEVLDTLGSRAAIGRILGISRQATAKLVTRGYVIGPAQRDYLLKLRRACPHVSVAALCGIDEGK